ncbi:MAG: hypothetical protein U0165_01950 [Polyangiaceae bacterium]
MPQFLTRIALRRSCLTGLAQRASAGVVVLGVMMSARNAFAEPSKLAPEIGWDHGEIETARTGALGGATRASGNSTTAIWSNPASMAATKVYHIEGLAEMWPEARRQSYGIAAVDSVMNSYQIAGGVGAAYTLQDPDGLKRKAVDVRVGLAMPLGDRFFAGVGMKYLRLEQNGLGPLGRSLASGGLSKSAIINGWTFDAGVAARPIEWLTIGLLGTNLTNPGNSFQPTGFGGGLSIGNQDFSLSGDVVADFTTYQKTTLRAMGGGEYLAADRFPLRLGYRFDDGEKTHAISGGAGYIDRSFGVSASIRRTVSGEASTAIFLGLQFFVESTGATRDPTMPNGGYF